MTNEKLAELIQEGGNDELLPLLWDKTRLLIYKKCGRLWQLYSEKLEQFGYSFDDLQQEGYNALTFAVKSYKSEKGYKFTTYLNYALKHVIRCLLSGGTDVLNQTGTMSLEQPLSEDMNGGVLYIADTITDKHSAVAFEEIERLDEYRVLYEAVDSLPPDQRITIYEYYFKGFTRKRIAEIHSCTESDVRRTLHKALCSLRTGETGEQLRAIYGEDYGIYSIRHKGLTAFKRSGTSEIEDYVLRLLGKTSIHKP